LKGLSKGVVDDLQTKVYEYAAAVLRKDYHKAGELMSDLAVDLAVKVIAPAAGTSWTLIKATKMVQKLAAAGRKKLDALKVAAKAADKVAENIVDHAKTKIPNNASGSEGTAIIRRYGKPRRPKTSNYHVTIEVRKGDKSLATHQTVTKPDHSQQLERLKSMIRTRQLMQLFRCLTLRQL